MHAYGGPDWDFPPNFLSKVCFRFFFFFPSFINPFPFWSNRNHYSSNYRSTGKIRTTIVLEWRCSLICSNCRYTNEAWFIFLHYCVFALAVMFSLISLITGQTRSKCSHVMCVDCGMQYNKYLLPQKKNLHIEYFSK